MSPRCELWDRKPSTLEAAWGPPSQIRFLHHLWVTSRDWLHVGTARFPG